MNGEHTTQEETQEKKESSSQSPFVMLALGILIALFLGFGIYYSMVLKGVKSLSQSDFILTSAKTLQMPVAKINGVKILYTDYVDQLRAMNTFYDTDDTGMPRPSDEEMSDYVLSRMMLNQLIVETAKEFDTDVSQEELDAIVIEQILPSFDNNEEQAHEEIKKRYGWEFDVFVQNIVYATELEKKVVQAFIESQDVDDTDVKSTAQDVLEKLKNGEVEFVDMALEHGTDGTATQGGDLGWFGRGAMVPPFEEAVFALEAGQLGEALVETDFGFHIVKVDERRTTTDEETGEDVEEIKARHILFRSTAKTVDDFPTFMNERLVSADIEVLETVHNPFEEFLNNAEEEDDSTEDVDDSEESGE